VGWHVGSGGDGGVGGNPKIVLSPLSGRAMERIEGSETSNQEFGPVPVRTLKFNLGVSILLGEGGGVFRVCMCVEAITPVDQMSTGFLWLVFLMTLGATWPK